MTEQSSAIHLVDRDSDVLLILFDTFNNAGFRVSASSTFFEALNFISTKRPDAALYPMEMPEMDGFDFLRRVVESSPTTRVILTSRHPDERMHEAVLQAGGAELLPSPFTRRSVIQAVERVLGTGVPYMVRRKSEDQP